MRIFIHNANGYFEEQICKLLKDTHRLVGTIDESGPDPIYLEEVIKDNTKEVKRAILESNCIIYRITNEGIEDAKFSIKVLEGTKYKDPKIFVLISSYMSWAATPKQYIEDEDEDDEDTEDDEDGKVEKKKKKKRKDYDPFSIDQVITRKAHNNFLEFLEMEKRVKRAECKTLKPIVIFPGLLYGQGEDFLHPLFKQAWEGKEENLCLYKEGLNFVPMIHVVDLANIAKSLIEDPIDEEKYFFAVDEAKSTWSDIVEVVSGEFVCGKARRLNERGFYLKYQNADYFTTDLKLSIPENVESMEFDWASKKGFVKNFRKIRKEFEMSRFLSPLKVCIFGPPGVGKTHFSKKLMEKYKIPHIKVKELVDEFFAQEEVFAKEVEELGAEVNRQREEIAKEKERKRLLKEQKKKDREERRRLREEKRKKIEEGELSDTEEEDTEEEDTEEEEEDEEEEGTENKIVDPPELVEAKKRLKYIQDLKSEVDDKERYTDEVLTVIYKWKLNQRIPRNRGWIVDGYPKSFKQAQLFVNKTKKRKKDDDEDGDDDEEDSEEEDSEEDSEEEDGEMKEELKKFKKIDPVMVPDYIINFASSKEVLENRLMKIDENDMERFERRFEEYGKNNTIDETGMLAYIEERVVLMENQRQAITKDIKVEKVDEDDEGIMKGITDFIGKAHNYGPTKEEIELEEKRKREKIEEEEKTKEDEKMKENDRIENEKMKRKQILEEQKQKLEEIRKQEQEMLHARSAPLREYLMENVLPTLTKGLIEVSKVKDEDPIDYLANFLFEHSKNQKD